jgi:hypothetical protein
MHSSIYRQVETICFNKAFLKQYNPTSQLAKALIHAYAHTYIHAPHAQVHVHAPPMWVRILSVCMNMNALACL